MQARSIFHELPLVMFSPARSVPRSNTLQQGLLSIKHVAARPAVYQTRAQGPRGGPRGLRQRGRVCFRREFPAALFGQPLPPCVASSVQHGRVMRPTSAVLCTPRGTGKDPWRARGWKHACTTRAPSATSHELVRDANGESTQSGVVDWHGGPGDAASTPSSNLAPLVQCRSSARLD